MAAAVFTLVRHYLELLLGLTIINDFENITKSIKATPRFDS